MGDRALRVGARTGMGRAGRGSDDGWASAYSGGGCDCQRVMCYSKRQCVCDVVAGRPLPRAQSQAPDTTRPGVPLLAGRLVALSHGDAVKEAGTALVGRVAAAAAPLRTSSSDSLYFSTSTRSSGQKRSFLMCRSSPLRLK